MSVAALTYGLSMSKTCMTPYTIRTIAKASG